MLLPELVHEVVQLRDVLQGTGRLAVTERPRAPYLFLAAPVQVRAQCPKIVAECRHFPAQRPASERLRHQLGQLLALARRQRTHQPLAGSRPPGQDVHQLVDRTGFLREVVTVAAHELGELVGGVLAPGMALQQGVEVVHHLGGGLLGGRIRQALLQAPEPLLHDLLAQSVKDLLVEPAGLVAGPVIPGQFLHRPGGRARQTVQYRLCEPRVVIVAPGQLVAFGRQRLVEQLLGPGHRAVEVAAAHGLAAHPPRPGPQVVEAAPAGWPAPQQLPQRVAQAAAGEHVLTHRVDRGANVVRRGERVRTALPRPVPVASHSRLP